MRLLQLRVEAAHVVEELEGQVEAEFLDRVLRRDLGHQTLGVRNVHFLGNSARGQPGEEGVKATDDPGAVIADVHVPLGQQAQDLGVVGRFDDTKRRGSHRRDGDRMGVVGIVLV